jgi:hypothetical protein
MKKREVAFLGCYRTRRTEEFLTPHEQLGFDIVLVIWMSPPGGLRKGGCRTQCTSLTNH